MDEMRTPTEPIYIASETKECPTCGGKVEAAAESCPTCGATFEVYTRAYCTRCHKLVHADGEGHCPDCGGDSLLDPRCYSRLLIAGRAPVVQSVPEPEASRLSGTPAAPPVLPSASAIQPPAPVSPVPPGSPDNQPARIHCHKCKTVNSPDTNTCQNCGTNLLPGISTGERILTLVVTIMIVGACGFAGFASLGKEGISPACSAILILFAFSSIVAGMKMVFARSPIHERYYKRAKRHLPLNPQQALDDFSRAIEQAPEKERRKYLDERASLNSKLGRTKDTDTDYRKLLEEINQKLPKASPGEKAALLKERASLYEYFHMPEQATRDLLAATYAKEEYLKNANLGPGKLGEDIADVVSGGYGDAFAAGVAIQKKKDEQKLIGIERLRLLETGRIKAIGYCPQCKEAVELDTNLLCPKDGKKPKHNHVLYVMPDEAEQAKARMLASRGRL